MLWGRKLRDCFFPNGDALELGEGRRRRADYPPKRPFLGSPRGGRDPIQMGLGTHATSIGSQSWLVHHSRSASDKNLIAADAHLPPHQPATLYWVHLDHPEWSAIGTTLPGVPILWSGKNRHLAWATSHAPLVAVDLFNLEIAPEDSGRYRDGRRFRSFSQRREEIIVRGAPNETLLVRETDRAVVIDLVIAPGRSPMALAWTGGQGVGIGGFMRAVRTRQLSHFRQALRAHHAPLLQVLATDRKNRAAAWLAGWMPERKARSHWVPLAREMLSGAWQRRFDPQKIPEQVLSREDPVLIVAGTVPNRYENLPGFEWWWPNRGRHVRIRELFQHAAAKGKLNAEDLVDMQGDLRSASALALRNQLLGLLPKAKLDLRSQELVSALKKWNGELGFDSAEAALLKRWAGEVEQQLLENFLGPELARRYAALPQRPSEGSLALLLKAALLRSFAGGESLEEMVLAGFRRAQLSLRYELGVNHRNWSWGAVQQVYFESPWFPYLPKFGKRYGPYPVAGDGSTVALASSGRKPPFLVQSASVLRFVADMGAPDHVLALVAPGQLEAVRELGIQSWLRNEPWAVPLHRLLVDQRAIGTIALEPER